MRHSTAEFGPSRSNHVVRTQLKRRSNDGMQIDGTEGENEIKRINETAARQTKNKIKKKKKKKKKKKTTVTDCIIPTICD